MSSMRIFYLITAIIFFYLTPVCSYSQKTKYTISGYVKEITSNELLPGVTVYIPSINSGTITNNYGFYSITLEPGEYELIYTFVGFEGIKSQVVLDKDIELNQFLTSSVDVLEEVVVTSELQEKASESTQMSILKLPTKSVEQIPALMGEKDVLKVLQLMPGVQSGSEGSSGLYVRGGGPDQNLLILDDAIVYNASHLFGFFSIFNGDALKSTELYKGGFPARFGGRLSSVIKMDMKDGNKEETHGKVGVGLISSSLLLEGPMNKGKTSYIVSARRTYLDALVAPFNKSSNKGGYYFYDLNAKVNHEFNSRNKLYLSGYFGEDNFYSKNKSEKFDSEIGWGNASSTTRWNHQFSNKLFSNMSLIFSKYQFVVSVKNKNAELKYNSGIRDWGVKYDLDFFPSLDHSLKFGISMTNHLFTPSAIVIKEIDLNPSNNKEEFNTVESAVYVEDDMRLFDHMNMNIGFRLSHFIHKKEIYLKPEPRISLAYHLSNNYAIKASYASMNQYVHLLSNSGIGLPTDLWVSSTDQVKPQSSEQVAFGAAKDLNNGISITLEGYIKKSNNVIAYRENASFVAIDDPESAERVSWEDNITSGEANAMGIELFVQKKAGDFNGWFGYTLSKTELQFDELNFGRKFLSKYDRRHDVSLVGIYNISPRLTLSGTWVYGTGNNFSLPLRKFKVAEDNYGGISKNSFNEIETLNNFRAEAYHRLDLSVRMTKEKKRGKRTWELSVYNAYSRKNPFFYYRQEITESSVSKGILKKASLFPLLPSIRYTFEF